MTDSNQAMNQLIGEAEKARIFADEQARLDELCAYSDTLCLADNGD